MALDTLLGRPIIEKTPSGLRRITRFRKLDPDGPKVANVETSIFLPYGTADKEFTTAILVEQKIDRRAEQGAASTLIQVFQELADNALTATTEVSESTTFDGRRVTRTTYLCKSSQAATLRPSVNSGSPVIFQVDVEKNGPVAKVVTYAIELTSLGFVLSDSTETKNNGALSLRSIRTIGAAPATPSGYILVSTSTQTVDGYTVFNSQFARGSGEISRSIDLRSGGKLTITTIRHLTAAGTSTQPTSDPGGATLISTDKSQQDGYIVWTVGWAAGSGEISRATDYRFNQMLQRITIRHLTAISVTAQPTTDPAGGGTIVGEDKSDQDGYRVWTVTWQKVNVSGLISDSVETRNNGRLKIYRRSRFNAAPDQPAATIGGTVTLVTSVTRQEDGYTVYDYTWAEGVGEVDRDVSYRQSVDQGTTGVTITVIRHLTATAASDPTALPGSVKIAQAIEDGEGYRMWRVTYAKGTGTVATDTTSRNNGKLIITRKTGLGAAPTAPVSAIGGTVALVQSDVRNDSGFVVYDYQWAEGHGVIATNTQTRDGGLRLETWVSIGTKETPQGIVLSEDTDEVDGMTRYTVTCMQGADGGSPTAGSLSTIVVTDGGSGYTSPPTVTITGGGGSGATAVAIMSGSAVASVSLGSAGSGYTTTPTITLTGGGGTGATAIALLAATSVASATITDAGSGYTSAPTVTASGGGGSGATFAAALTPTTLGSIAVTSPGSGYTAAPTVTLSGGGGTGATATATISSAGQILSITLTNPGANYTSAPTVSLSGGGGSGASAVANLTPTGIGSVTLLTGGLGYTAAPTVVVSGGGGVGAVISAQLSGGAVASVTLGSSGTGYTSAPTVTLSGGGGSGATATAQLAPSAVSSIALVSGGSGYTSTPTVTISGGGGSGATATATISGGAVTGFTITNGGSGYTGQCTINVSGGGGTGALGSARVAPTGVGSISIPSYPHIPSGGVSISFSGGGGSGASAIAAIDGIVYNVGITSFGSGYTSIPTVTISGGGGSGATAVAAINAAGQVVELHLTNQGAGYTSTPTITFSGGGGAGASAIAYFARTFTAITITSAGSGYTSRPLASFSGGTGFLGSLFCDLIPGALTSAVVSSGGSGYTSTPTATIATNLLNDPPRIALLRSALGAITGVTILYGGYFSAIPTISIVSGGTGASLTVNSLSAGRIGSITIGSGGTGYYTTLLTYAGGVGSGATATAAISASAVTGLALLTPGSGYTSAPSVSISGGGGSGATATAQLFASYIASLTLVTGGAGYVSAPSVSFSGGGGSGAAGTTTIGASSVTALTIDNPGSGYTSSPTLTFVGGGGAGAAGSATISGTSIASFSMVSGGSGYSTAPSVSLSGGSGSGGAGTAVVSTGSVLSITVTGGGSGYTSAPTVSLSGGGGTGTTAAATLTGTSIASIAVSANGSGYTSPPTLLVAGGGGGFGAAMAILNPTSLAALALVSGGSGYSSAPSVSISGGGGGSGATGTASLGSSSSVASIHITAAGSGFTSAPTIGFTGGGGSGATATAAVASGFSYEDKDEFLYPGRAEARTTTIDLQKAFDIFRSPPVRSIIDVTVHISYQASNSIGSLADPLWNPDSWATIKAKFRATDGWARFIAEALPNYRSVDDTPIAFDGGLATAELQTCLGEKTIPAVSGTPYSLAVIGGPEEPDGNTYTLSAKLAPAFLAKDGTQYYRLTRIVAEIPAQPALPA